MTNNQRGSQDPSPRLVRGKKPAIRWCLACVLALGWLWPQSTFGQPLLPVKRDGGPAGGPNPAVQPTTAPLSDAEKVSRLRQSIEEAQARLAELKAKIAPAEGAAEPEVSKAEKAFRILDEERNDKQAALDAASAEGLNEKVDKLSQELGEVQSRWQLAKDRFDLALKEHKSLQEQAATVEARLKQDQEALSALLAPTAPVTKPALPTEGGKEATTEPTTAPIENAAPIAAPGVQTPMPAAPVAQEKPANGIAGSPTAAKPPSKEVVKAQEKAQEKEAAAQQAEQAAKSVEERLDLLKRQIKTERELLQTAQGKADLARQEENTLQEQLRVRRESGEAPSSYRDLADSLWDARNRKDNAVAEASDHAARVEKLYGEMAEVQSEQIGVLREAQNKRGEAEQAQSDLQRISNPFSLENLRNWMLKSGPRVIGIILGVVLLLWLTKVLRHRLALYFAKQSEHGSFADRVNRARTLTSVLQNAFTIAVIAVACLMLLTEFGVNAGPLLGGAAVVGLAVAFGAQNLIRDFFSGFMILLENQYGIEDVIKVGDVAGLVEDVTMRVTVLRDLEGVVHFIPNGEIKVVSNMTHGWSRAMFDIGIAYKEDVDRVMDVLMTLAEEMRSEPAWRHIILEKPRMLGVDALADSAVMIKFYVKTKPLKQWDVKRELLRRIKNRFDELGIEIPFPHRTIFHRYEQSTMTGSSEIEVIERELKERMRAPKN